MAYQSQDQTELLGSEAYVALILTLLPTLEKSGRISPTPNIRSIILTWLQITNINESNECIEHTFLCLEDLLIVSDSIFSLSMPLFQLQ